MAALRPLQLAEILDALSIDLRERRLNREIAPVHGYALLDALGSLVVYNEETDVIILSHSSVKVSCKHLAYLRSGLTYHLGVPDWKAEPHEPVRVSYQYESSSCTGGTALHVLHCCRDQILATLRHRGGPENEYRPVQVAAPTPVYIPAWFSPPRVS